MATAASLLTPAEAPERQDVDFKLSEFVLDPENRAVKFGKGASSLNIIGAVVDTTFTLTIEGASTVEITVQDTGGKLLTGDLLTGWAWGTNADDRVEAHWMLDGRAIDAQLDDIWFRLTVVELQELEVLKLTFEERLVAQLRAHSGARKVYRDAGVTRAEFIRQLAKGAGLSDDEIYIPELHVAQAVAKSSDKITASERKAKGKKGLNRGANLTVKGKKATTENFSVAQTGLDVGDSLKAPAEALVAYVAALIDENDMTNKAGGDSTSSGSLQLLASTAKNLGVSARDVKGVAKLFFTKGFYKYGGAIKLARQGHKAAEIATMVQGNRDGASSYAPFVAEARKWVAAYMPGISSSGELDITVQKPYAFARGKNETSWDAIQRLAGEVQWRAFVRQGVLWYASEEYLFAQAPQIQIERGEGGVEEVTGTIDLGARNLVAELSVTARAGQWTALPGMVGAVKNRGPADGRWLIHEVSGVLTNDAVTVTLDKPLPAKLEPANETDNVSIDTGSADLGGAAAGPIGKVLQEAINISRRNYPYVWGGGHGTIGKPSGGGYDCSGYVSACLGAGGLLHGAPLDSNGLARWGEAGRGKYMTVYANSEHTFIVFEVGKIKRADTSPHGEGKDGPHTRLRNRDTSGFTARHAKGL